MTTTLPLTVPSTAAHDPRLVAVLSALAETYTAHTVAAAATGNPVWAEITDDPRLVEVITYLVAEYGPAVAAVAADLHLVAAPDDATTTPHTWPDTVPVCDGCFDLDHPDQEPTRVMPRDIEPCAVCGVPTNSGIYVFPLTTEDRG
ncbi:hypothetical protein ACTD5D_32150 [Nocardia takedensis]|uniref:hypothetical protein n=1 Tax=Nocardia takedensis TaxID=259390 RepID=UPI003F76B79E